MPSSSALIAQSSNVQPGGKLLRMVCFCGSNPSNARCLMMHDSHILVYASPRPVFELSFTLYFVPQVEHKAYCRMRVYLDIYSLALLTFKPFLEGASINAKVSAIANDRKARELFFRPFLDCPLREARYLRRFFCAYVPCVLVHHAGSLLLRSVILRSAPYRGVSFRRPSPPAFRS